MGDAYSRAQRDSEEAWEEILEKGPQVILSEMESAWARVTTLVLGAKSGFPTVAEAREMERELATYQRLKDDYDEYMDNLTMARELIRRVRAEAGGPNRDHHKLIWQLMDASSGVGGYACHWATSPCVKWAAAIIQDERKEQRMENVISIAGGRLGKRR